MEKNNAKAQRYMTVGEAAKKMEVTVRTLQYYDKEGVLSPSALSEGGRRLYTDKDLIRLHQILSLKHLGFSLDDIKNRLIPLDTPADVAGVLAQQAAAIREKIETLAESLKEIEMLRAEVLQMQSVDFKKYADIIVNLKMKNDFYWLIKHFDDQMLDYIRDRFDKERGMAFIHTFSDLQSRAIQLQKDGMAPDSEEGQRFAKAFWDLIMEFTDGDMRMLPKLMEVGRFDGLGGEWKDNQRMADAYIGPALDAYLTKQGLDPFKEEPI